MEFTKHLGRRVVSIILSVMILISLIPMSAINAYAETLESLTVTIDTGADVTLSDSDGNGYYDIGTADELYAFAAAVNNGNTSINAELTADIVINEGEITSSSREYTPIGSSSSAYTGVFDGQNYAIDGLYINITDYGHWGLFGYANGATIKNFSLSGEAVANIATENTSSSVHFGSAVGEIVYGAVVENVHSSVNYTSNDSYFKNTVAGVVGASYNTGTGITINKCSYSGNINLNTANIDCCAGIIAYAMAAQPITVTNCGFYGTITTEYDVESEQIGGIMGYYRGNVLSISNCLSVGTITSPNSACNGAIMGVLRQHTYANTKVVNNYYIEGATPFGNHPGTSSSTITDDITDGYNSQTIEGSATAATSAQFASGEIAYLLQGEQTVQAWGQTINVDTYPVINGAKVYQVVNCKAETAYSNTNEAIDHIWNIYGECTVCGTECEHDYDNGICKVNGCYQPADYEETTATYTVSNAGQLMWYAAKVNDKEITATHTVVLANDIVIPDSIVWAPIYIGGNLTFDGCGYSITMNQNYDTGTTTASNYGLFGLCNYNIIKNLVLKGSITANTSGRVAALSCSSYRTTVENVVSYVDVTNNCTTAGEASGLMAYFGGKHSGTQYSLIKNCAVYADVTGYIAGGIVAEGWNGTQYYDITNAAYVGDITGINVQGAIIGYQATDTGTSTFTNIYWYEPDGLSFYGKRDTANQVYTNTEAKTAEQFASGEVAYLLQGEQEEQVWGQNIDNGEEVQATPVISDAKVYQVLNCKDETVYSNTDKAIDHIWNKDGECTVCGTKCEHEEYDNGFCTVCGTECEHEEYNNGFCTVCDAYQPAVYNDETGNYEISNAGQLYWFADKVNNDNETFGSANAVLTKSIVVNEGVLDENGNLVESDSYRSWIGIDEYSGTFDGCGFTVSGICGCYCVFGGITETGIVENLGVVDSYFFEHRFGGIVIQNNGTVRNCYSASTFIIEDAMWAACIVSINNGKVENCYNLGKLHATDGQFGAVVGINYADGEVINCYNTGSLSSELTLTTCGVICDNYGTITNCYNTGSMNGSNSVGGVVGINRETGVITNCYNTGSVSGEYNIGGVVGHNYDGTITNCYYLDTCAVDGGIDGGDVAGSVEAKTAEQFASGEVAYLLQGEQEEQIWGQNLDNGKEVQTTPVFSDAKVYCGYATCDVSATEIYSNSQLSETILDHNYDNGFCTVCDAYQPAVYNDETGNYEISNAGQLYWFADKVNNDNENYGSANAVLTKSIVVNEGVLDENGDLVTGVYRSWTPIGNYSSSVYSGIFDGCEHTVSGLYFNTSSIYCVGLFGYVKGTVQNTGVIDSYFNGKNVGGVVGVLDVGTITNCYNTGTVSGSSCVGGVVAYSYVGTITNCYNTGTVSGSNYVGGVVGNLDVSAITNCYNTGTVSGSNYVGGVVGSNHGTITNCYNTGSVSGNINVGGVAGTLDDGTITNCYNTGSVSGSSYVGGVAWHYTGDTITNCYYLADSETDDIDGTTYKTSAQFASGEVAYLLQGEQTEQVWGQNIDNGEEVQATPVISDAKVYRVLNCKDETVYSNTDKAIDHIWNNDGECTVCGTKCEHEEYNNGFCTVCDGYQPAVYNEDTGNYEISNAGQLYWFADKVNNDNENYGSANAVLTKNIVVNEGVLDENGDLVTGVYRSWTPIGNTWSTTYSGTFDGCGFTVSGLYINESSVVLVGLFGVVDSGGAVKNIGLVDSYISAGGNAAGIVANLKKGSMIDSCYNASTIIGGTFVNANGNSTGIVAGVVACDNNIDSAIENCYNTGSVTNLGKQGYTGGVVGSFSYDTLDVLGYMKNCYNTGKVTGRSNVGGVCGYQCADIIDCYNTGAVAGTSIVGGIAGYTSQSHNGYDYCITNCYNTGDITGTKAIGGIGGDCHWVKNCQNSGNITGEEYVGGIMGRNMGIVSNSVNYGQVSGTRYIGGICNSAQTITIEYNCYNVGDVSGDEYVGGVCGYVYYGELTNCYNIGTVSCAGEYEGGIVSYINYPKNSTITDCYYLADSETDDIDGTTYKTSAQFESGEVAYLLQGDQEEQVWGQNIDNGKEVQTTPVFSDAKVYYGYATCDASVAATYSNSQLSETKPDHTWVNGVCSVCGETDRVAGYTLTLGEKIAVNYYMHLSENTLADENAKMVFTVPDTGSSYTVEIPVSEGVRNGTYYVFTCEVAAKEMASAIKSKLVRSDSELEFADYAIVDYAKGILADTTKYADEQDIVKAMLNYGAYSQVYFGYNTDNLANAILADEDKVLDETLDLSSYAYTVSGEETDVEFYGCIPSLKSETALKLYFDIDSSVDVESLTFTVNGTEVTPVKNGSYYEVKISGIAAHQLANTYTVTVGGLTVEYGVFSYGNIAMGTSKTALKDVVKAMYAYSQEADAYSELDAGQNGRE